MTAHQIVTWEHVNQTDGCFFFSGPDGRDDQLTGIATIERTGSAVKMTIGSAQFEGAYREGTLDLVRVSPHVFDGRWFALERVHGIYKNGQMTARYRYNECEHAGACPSRCTLTGEMTLVPVR